MQITEQSLQGEESILVFGKEVNKTGSCTVLFSVNGAQEIYRLKKNFYKQYECQEKKIKTLSQNNWDGCFRNFEKPQKTINIRTSMPSRPFKIPISEIEKEIVQHSWHPTPTIVCLSCITFD